MFNYLIKDGSQKKKKTSELTIKKGHNQPIIRSMKLTLVDQQQYHI